MVLSLLGRCSVPWFLFPLLFLREFGGCVLPDKKFSEDLIGVPTEGFWSNMILCIGAYT